MRLILEGEFFSPVDMTCSCHALVITVKDD